MNIAKVMLIQDILEDIKREITKKEDDSEHWQGDKDTDKTMRIAIQSEIIGLKKTIKIICKNVNEVV